MYIYMYIYICMYLWMMCCIHRIIKYICDLFKHAFVSTGYTEAYCFMGEARDLGWITSVQKLEWTCTQHCISSPVLDQQTWFKRKF